MKLKSLIIFIIFVTRINHGFSQLVLNGDFEISSFPYTNISGCLNNSIYFPGYFPNIYLRGSDNLNNCVNGRILKNTCCDLRIDYNLKRAPSGNFWFVLDYHIVSYKEYLSFQLSSPLIKNKAYVIRLAAANHSNFNTSTDTLEIGLSDSITLERQHVSDILKLDSNGYRTYARLVIPNNEYLYIQLSRTSSAPIIINDFALDNIRLDTCVKFNASHVIEKYKCSTSSIRLEVSTIGNQHLWSNNDTLSYTYVNDEGIYLSYTYETNQCVTIDSFIVKNTDTIYTKTDTNVCYNQNIKLQNKSPNGTSYKWSNGSNSNETLISKIGNYSLKIGYSNGCIAIDSFHLKNYNIYPPVINKDSGLCNGTKIYLNIFSPDYQNYLWSTGDTTSYINIDKAGWYKVKVSDNNCEFIDSILIYNFIKNSFLIPLDTSICFDEFPTIDLDAGPWTTYHWYPNGENTQVIKINTPGNYKVIVTDPHNCLDSTSILVQNECSTKVYIPNAFSPNGDGINDLYEIKSNAIEEIIFDLYDRWGGHIIRITGVSVQWDGKVSDLPIQDGVYCYRIYYKTKEGMLNKNGYVTIIH